MSGINAFGQSSGSPFGSTSGFGQNSNNLFAPKPFGSSGGFGSQTRSSIFGSTSTGVFGAQSSSSPLGSTSAFGASPSPAFGNSTPAFGASAFGNTSSAFGVSSAFGQNPAFGGFGSTAAQTSSFGGFGSTAAQTSSFGGLFQQSQPALGSSLSGTSTPFGAQSQTAFGAFSTRPFGASGNSAFGATSSDAFGGRGCGFGVTSPAFSASSSSFGTSTSSFGATNTSAFGVLSMPAFSASSAPSFGFRTSTPAFGQPASAFVSGSFVTSPFGVQSSSFGAQTTSSSLGGASPFGGQRGGSRAAPYSSTPEIGGGTSSQPAGNLASLSAMPVYKDKSHDELRWEDYQLGEKGGATGISAACPCSSTFAFVQTTPVPPFSSSTSVTAFPPKIPAFNTDFRSSYSTSAICSSPFVTSTMSSPFLSTPSSTPSLFLASTSPSIFSSSTTSTFVSPPFCGPSSSQATTTTSGGGSGLGNTQSPPLFQLNMPTMKETSSPFLQTSSQFNQTTTPGVNQLNLFSAPPTGTGGNLFSTLSQSNISSPGFVQTTSVTTPFQPAQPGGGFSFSTSGQSSQSAFAYGPSVTPGTVGSGVISQPSVTQSLLLPQAAQISNPFGNMPAMPQISINISCNGTSPTVQYGISSLPVVDKPIPVRTSPLLTSRHLLQRRPSPKLPMRNYTPKTDGSKVPFFCDEEEMPGAPKADAFLFFVPRENPRAMLVQPLEQWPSRPNFETSTPSNGTTSDVHENGEASANGRGTEDRNHVSVKKPEGNVDQPKEQCDDSAKGNKKRNESSIASSSDNVDSYITLTGHRAGEAAIVYEHGAEVKALIPKLRHSDYYTEPSIQELAAKERAGPGYCRHVEDFAVGRQGYGSIRFFGKTDVRSLDLESVIQFNIREVKVYMDDDSKKPPVGEGLNKPAEVTLLNIKCFDKNTGEQYTEGPKIEKYIEMLKRRTEEQGAEFVSYEAVKGEWKFRVDHF